MTSIADVSSRSISELVSLSGRTAVVTGAGRGLGKAIAARLSEAGANVAIGDIEGNGDLARSAAGDLAQRYGGRTIGAFMNVAETSSVKAVADLAVETFGGIDIWVNNAGIFPSVRIPDLTDELWDQVLDVNGRGVFVGSREAATRMIAAERGGVIVNIVSTAGFKGVAPGLAAYVSSIGRAAYDFEAREVRGELIGSGPVSDTLGLRVATAYSDGDGYFRNRAIPIESTGAVAPDARATNPLSFFIRGTALWKPVDGFSARLKVNHAYDKSTNAELAQLTNCADGAGHLSRRRPS
ncbi:MULTISPECIES: SDR family NAD(P)-dependent oxidoreductase [unclassified Novosphingobium]|uniref:SDR family NAD(P)-dependent oxidoreductase n=1 Tax=unclassified Novosphingobium TaxID=2644732 RepID=UPI00135B6069|nr:MULTISPECIES: SDR family NAD(P)-dependent oxidoreductase [unclassified Novosphingobium]